MKAELVPGVTFTRQIRVDRPRTIDFMGDEGRVYSTPSLVNDIEMTCYEGLLEYLDAGESSVGTHVELDHLAATLLDMNVTIDVRVAEVKGRLVTFEVTARDTLDEIGRGKHVRFVVDVVKTVERLKAKAARASATAGSAS
ncbi:MAG: hotdog domain-containing protein [Candidatus Velthaea sp.]|jgi:predicted thioesterase